MILVAIGLVDRSRRRSAVLAAGSLLVIGVAMAVLFPGTGTMPFTVSDAIPAGLCYLGVVLVCRARVVQVSAGCCPGHFPAVACGTWGDRGQHHPTRLGLRGRRPSWPARRCRSGCWPPRWSPLRSGL